jgi:hypothetical protein
LRVYRIHVFNFEDSVNLAGALSLSMKIDIFESCASSLETTTSSGNVERSSWCYPHYLKLRAPCHHMQAPWFPLQTRGGLFYSNHKAQTIDLWIERLAL